MRFHLIDAGEEIPVQRLCEVLTASVRAAVTTGRIDRPAVDLA